MTAPATGSDRFACLSGARRVWAVAAVRGERARLSALHAVLERRVWRGDRLVYLGNLLGVGPDVAGAVDELLVFRRAILARPGFEPEDIVVLRGAQEEMLHQLLRLHFAPGPATAVEAVRWMADHGVAPTLAAYGTTVAEALRVAAQGPVERARWTSALMASIRARPGHENLLTSLKRAAYTVPRDLAGEAPGTLFVAAGLDPTRPFEAQGDAFWWHDAGFERAAEGIVAEDGACRPWGGFARLVRGFSRRADGPIEHGYGVTLDAGSGLGGRLVAACLSPGGEIQEIVEA